MQGTTSPTPPTLVVTVDTEEEGLWNGRFKAQGNTVENIKGVTRFQNLCDRYGVRPTYLVDTPVAEDDGAVGILQEIFNSGRCEIGAHLHPWCAPPFVELVDSHSSFMCNLPERLQREKLTRLTDTIHKRFGSRPTSFRAGRYGLDLVGARILTDLGYQVDSSVISFTDYTAQGGPDFRTAPFKPYRVGWQDMCVPAADGWLLEIPVSVGYNRRNFSWAHRIHEFGQRPRMQRLHVIGVLDRLGLVRRTKFSPEQASAAHMRRLVKMYIANGSPAMVMMLHSTSLTPGFSPYTRDTQQLDQFHRHLEATFAYCLGTCHMDSRTLTQFALVYPHDQATPPAQRVGAARLCQKYCLKEL